MLLSSKLILPILAGSSAINSIGATPAESVFDTGVGADIGG